MKPRPGKMMRLIVAALVATSCGHATSVAAADRLVVIEIRNSSFVQADVRARPGDTVVWRNQDIVPHTATAKDASWDSGLIPAGGEWRLVISSETTVNYYCVYHPSMVAALDVSTQ